MTNSVKCLINDHAKMEILNSLLSLVVKNTCCICSRNLIEAETYVCFHCLSEVEKTHFHKKLKGNELCLKFAGRLPISGACALFYFDKKGILQRLMRELKYNDAPELGFFLGQYYGSDIEELSYFRQMEGILPVPLHPKRLRERGYNQAMQIARGLASRIEVPVLEKAVLRKRATRSQTKKSGDARWQNVSGIFEVVKPLPRRVLIVDDVITTGATVSAVIESLLQAETPPEEIGVLSIGMARNQ